MSAQDVKAVGQRFHTSKLNTMKTWSAASARWGLPGRGAVVDVGPVHPGGYDAGHGQLRDVHAGITGESERARLPLRLSTPPDQENGSCPSLSLGRSPGPESANGVHRRNGIYLTRVGESPSRDDD